MESVKTGRSAPWHFWGIAIVLLFWQGLAAFDYLATVFRYQPYLSNFTEDALEYFFTAPLWMYIMWALATIGGLLAAILVLMRNKLAVPVFATAWIGGLIANIYSWINPPPGMGDGALFAAAIVVTSALILFYLHSMKKRGVLR